MNNMDNFAMGIAIMSAMVSDMNDSSLAPVVIRQYLEDGVPPEHLISSMANVCSMLLVMHWAATGNQPEASLQMVVKMVNMADMKEEL